MERLTKKERVGLIAFTAVSAIGILVAVLVSDLQSEERCSDNSERKEIIEFEKRVLSQESDSATVKAIKKNKVKPKTVYQDIDPLKERLERKR